MNVDLIKDAGTGNHVNLLMNCLEAMDRNPQWFDAEVLPAASDFCNSELMAIERDLLTQNKEAAGQGDYVLEHCADVHSTSILASRGFSKEVPA